MTTTTPARPRILSGIQPSGDLHLGNYFGAIEHHIRLQTEGDAFYFVADYHALTSLRDPDRLRELTLEVVAHYLAFGLDPQRATLFRQSDVPEVTELMWVVSIVTGMGLLERAHAYKDKVAKGIPASAGLFMYPALMAADILAYRTEIVPVGQDQIQHIEITQDIARAFNAAFQREVFSRPEYRLSATPRVPGTDGQKMSKAHANTIPIFARGKELEQAVAAIVTDSRDYTKEPLDPDSCNVFALYCLFATDTEQEEIRRRYRDDRSFGYRHAKALLVKKIEERFGSAADRYEAIRKKPAELEAILEQGSRRARAVARQTVDEAREACGLGRMLSR